jgi:hypothetical protein
MDLPSSSFLSSPDGPRPNPEMTQDFTLWRLQVRQAITGLCALDGRPGTVDRHDCPAFRRALEALYVESHFTEFMACQGWRQAGLSAATGQALYDLQAQLDTYDEPDTDAAIVADPGWWAVRGLAGFAVALLA